MSDPSGEGGIEVEEGEQPAEDKNWTSDEKRNPAVFFPFFFFFLFFKNLSPA